MKKGFRRRQKSRCVYCGEIAKTRDHIPGKQFFPRRRRHQLITVPACRTCNSDHKADEDYARLLLCFGQGGVSEAGRELWEQDIPRTYQKDLGLRELIARALGLAEILTPAGLFLGRRMAITADWDRVFRVVEKCVRALYYVEYGERLPPNTKVDVGLVSHESREIADDLLNRTDPGTRTWPNLFDYKYGRQPDNDLRSVWLFRFFGVNEFVAFTGV